MTTESLPETPYTRLDPCYMAPYTLHAIFVICAIFGLISVFPDYYKLKEDRDHVHFIDDYISSAWHIVGIKMFLSECKVP